METARLGQDPAGGQRILGVALLASLLVVSGVVMTVDLSFADETGAPPTDPTASPGATDSDARPHTVDPTTLDQKVMFGYQGWFLCRGDGSPLGGWFHWFRTNVPRASDLTVDYWPDVAELDRDELCTTEMTLPDGSPAVVYSSYREKTVLRHLQWMEEYGIDGVFLQRFVNELRDPAPFAVRNQVVQHVRSGAERHGRVFAIMYDIGGGGPTLVQDIIDDWTYLVDTLRVTQSPRYLHQNGLPLLAIWGLGFNHEDATPGQAMELLDYFHTGAPARLRAVVMGGVPTWWRTLQGDSYTDPAWALVYRSFDILSPWTVGRYSDNGSADWYRDTLLVPDLAEATGNGVAYMPVAFPGFSWHNLFRSEPTNQIPRNGGHFFWRQVYNALSVGASMLYVAMFDEVDEGTAMYKLAATPAELPVEATLVSLDIDGNPLPPDWYLRLGGEASRMMRGEFPLTPLIPIQPDVAKPTIAVTSPTAGARLNGTSFTVRGTAADDLGLQRVDVRIDGEEWRLATGRSSWSLPVTTTAGLHTIDARARDTSGNMAVVRLEVVIVDPRGPTVSITSPFHGQTVDSPSVTVTGTAWAKVGIRLVEVSLDGGPWLPASGTSNWSATVTLLEGVNAIHARAIDQADRVATDSIEVTVHLAATGGGSAWPIPEAPLLIAVVVGIAAAALGGLWFLARRKRR